MLLPPPPKFKKHKTGTSDLCKFDRINSLIVWVLKDIKAALTDFFPGPMEG